MNYLPLVFVELCDRLCEQARVVRVDHLPFHIHEKRRMLVGVQLECIPPHARAGGTNMVDRPVARNSQKPWTQRGAFYVESLRSVPDPQESFLNQILRHRPVAHY